jgi:hypothetical protein
MIMVYLSICCAFGSSGGTLPHAQIVTKQGHDFKPPYHKRSTRKALLEAQHPLHAWIH